MDPKPLAFVIPTYRLRDVGETPSGVRGLQRGALELWPALVEIVVAAIA